MATVAQHEGEVLFVELPAAVELVIQETEPGVQGDRSTGGTKPATLETGYEIGVPLFITTGEKIASRSESIFVYLASATITIGTPASIACLNEPRLGS